MNGKTDARTWRELAIWLADCHAATAEHEGMLARTSQSSRKRYAEICDRAASSVERLQTLTGPGRLGPREAAAVAPRLRRAAEALRGES